MWCTWASNFRLVYGFGCNFVASGVWDYCSSLTDISGLLACDVISGLAVPDVWREVLGTFDFWRWGHFVPFKRQMSQQPSDITSHLWRPEPSVLKLLWFLCWRFYLKNRRRNCCYVHICKRKKGILFRWMNYCFCVWIMVTGIKIKVKFTLEQATKTQRGNKSIYLLFL